MSFVDRVQPGELFPIIQSLAVSQLSLRRDLWDVKQEAAVQTDQIINFLLTKETLLKSFFLIKKHYGIIGTC